MFAMLNEDLECRRPLHLLDTLLAEGDQEAGEAVEPKIPSAGSASTSLSRSEF